MNEVLDQTSNGLIKRTSAKAYSSKGVRLAQEFDCWERKERSLKLDSESGD